MIRALLVLCAIAVLMAALWAMSRGWSSRARRQSVVLPPPPIPPQERGRDLLPALTGLYVGTTGARGWQDRIVIGRLGARAAATAHAYRSGLVLERQGEPPVFVPAEDLIDARLDSALAGKVMGAGGLLVVQWRLAESRLDTGFRADDKSRYPEWIDALKGLVRS